MEERKGTTGVISAARNEDIAFKREVEADECPRIRELRRTRRAERTQGMGIESVASGVLIGRGTDSFLSSGDFPRSVGKTPAC